MCESLRPDPTTSAVVNREKPRGVPPIRSAIAIGLIVGFAELGIVLVRAQATSHGILHKGRHAVWMIPAAGLAFLTILGFALAIVCRFFPRLGPRVVPIALVGGGCFALLLAIPQLTAISCLLLSAGIAAWLGPWWFRKQAASRRVIDVLFAVGLGGFVLLVLASFGNEAWARSKAASQVRPSARGKPNVLLIVMDTVRAYNTTLAGYDRDTTPNLANFARRGAIFNRAIATAPWTLPSHASMFTGRWSWEVDVAMDRPLDDRWPTVAESLRENGYATGGFVANTVFCAAEYGLARGFDHYEDYPVSPTELMRSSSIGWLLNKLLRRTCDGLCVLLGRPPRHPFERDSDRKTAAEINKAFLSWVERRGDRPFFGFLNYFDAHDPYLLPSGAQSRFGREPKTLADYHLLRDWIGLNSAAIDADSLALARDAYDNCIAHLDEEIGRLLATLDASGILDNTIVVITSDHGEHFGEHGSSDEPLISHPKSVYQKEVRVPLVIVAPGSEARQAFVADPVSLRDLPTTICELAGLEEHTQFPGRSLAGFVRDRDHAPCSEHEVIAQFATRDAGMHNRRPSAKSGGPARALLRGPIVFHHRDDGRRELYDLAIDPGETNDLADTPAGRDLVDKLQPVLDRLAPPST